MKLVATKHTFFTVRPYGTDKELCGRNDFCPCGSGFKSKKCHMEAILISLPYLGGFLGVITNSPPEYKRIPASLSETGMIQKDWLSAKAFSE